LSTCAELANGVTQIAQNTALGMAAICGNSGAPVVDAPTPPLAPGLSNAISIRGLRGADRPVIASRGLDIPLKGFAPHAAAEFDGIDARGGIRSSIPALRNRMAALARPAQLQGPGMRAAQTIRDWDIGQAAADAADRQSAETLAASGGSLSNGYVFFADAEIANDAKPTAAGEATGTISGAGDVQSPADTAAGTTIVSGGAAAEVSGDNVDPMLKNYGLVPDTLLSRGGLTLSGGFSSVEGVSVGGKISRENIGGANRNVAATARYSKVRALFELGYTDGSLLGSSIGFAPTLFATRVTAKGFGGGRRATPFSQSALGLNVNFTRKLAENLDLAGGYRLSVDNFRMRGKSATCDPGFFGSAFCGALGKTTSSILSVSLAYDRRKREDRSTMRGFRIRLAQDVGAGGSAPYVRTRGGAEAHIGLGENWTLSVDAEGGFIAAIGKKPVPLFDRFYIGDASLRGFDLRGVGPKIQPAGAAPGQNVAIGGRAYYVARAELSGSVGGFLERHGLQPSLFVDAGSVFGANRSRLAVGEQLLGASAKPRVSAGIGLAMKTPAGTLRFDFARALLKQPGDRPKTFAFSFGAAI
jgi:Omp85 superfamily domain